MPVQYFSLMWFAYCFPPLFFFFFFNKFHFRISAKLQTKRHTKHLENHDGIMFWSIPVSEHNTEWNGPIQLDSFSTNIHSRHWCSGYSTLLPSTTVLLFPVSVQHSSLWNEQDARDILSGSKALFTGCNLTAKPDLTSSSVCYWQGKEKGVVVW